MYSTNDISMSFSENYQMRRKVPNEEKEHLKEQVDLLNPKVKELRLKLEEIGIKGMDELESMDLQIFLALNNTLSNKNKILVIKFSCDFFLIK